VDELNKEIVKNIAHQMRSLEEYSSSSSSSSQSSSDNNNNNSSNSSSNSVLLNTKDVAFQQGSITMLNDS
jgi:hypothetical protein